MKHFDRDTTTYWYAEFSRAEEVGERGQDTILRTPATRQKITPKMCERLAREQGYDTFEIFCVETKIERYEVS